MKAEIISLTCKLIKRHSVISPVLLLHWLSRIRFSGLFGNQIHSERESNRKMDVQCRFRWNCPCA